MENIVILRSTITRGGSPDLRDGTYTRALIPVGVPEVLKDDQYKVVISDKYNLIYRVNTNYQ
jgi:hypothetical protein